MLIRDEHGRIGIVTSHTDAGVFATPLGTPYKIEDKEGFSGTDNAILLTPTYWHREPDGSYTGKWYDSRLGDFVTAQEIPEQSFAASTMGRKGGKSRSDAKAAAARENGKRGGRPRKYTYDEVAPIALRDVEALLVHHGGWDAGDVDEILTDEERDRYAADIERAVRNLVALLNGSDCHSDAETREARISITRGIL